MPLGRYALVGLFSTMLDFLLLSLLYQFSANASLAKGASYALAASVSYALHRNWTFRSKVPLLLSSTQFLVTNLFSWIANLLFFSLILELSARVFVAAVSAFLVASIINFLGYRMIFARRRL